MSEPANDPQPSETPKAPEKGKVTPVSPPPPPQEFDLLAFWIQYGTVITRCIIILVLGGALWGFYMFWEQRKLDNSSEVFNTAKTAEDFRKVMAEWPGTPAAGSAQVLLAEELRKSGKFDDAAKELKDFAAKFPAHPLLASSIGSLAATYELAGKHDEALDAYKRIKTSYGGAAYAPLASIAIARIQIAKGQPDDALKALDEIIQKGAKGSFYVFEATRMQSALKNPNAHKVGGTPRPKPPEPPAPAPGAPGVPTPGAPNAPGTPAPAPAAPAPAPAAPK